MNGPAVVLAVLSTAVGAATGGSAGVALLAAGALLGAFGALRKPAPPRMVRVVGGAVAGAAAFALMVLFTLRVAAPNIVESGNQANENLAVSMLRTVLWAQDLAVQERGRAGLLGELAAVEPFGEAPALSAPLLREQFGQTLAAAVGRVATFSGYHYSIFVAGEGSVAATDGVGRPRAGSTAFVAYAWPVRPGESGVSAFCVNEHEDIFETDNAATTQRYAGVARVPSWDACPAAGGLGAADSAGDGGQWSRWRGRTTRRARDRSQPEG